MAIANELTIDTSASAMDIAQTIFGSGVVVTSATYSGADAASGIYTGALGTIPGVTNSDSGVILSTGNTGTFTNSDGSTNTNTQAGAGSDIVGGIDGDADMNGVSGQQTFDGAILEATFIPEGDWLTMQFVFTSDEYPEYVNLNVNDSFGVWVNGQFVEATITTSGNIAIDTVNQNQNQNLYQSNDADQFNTEMDGLTYILSFKAPVNPGVENTIKIGIADGGDAVFDSNVLISADSIQTVALAFDDTVQVVANGTRTVDVLANDSDLYDTGLTITHVMGQPISVGQTVTIATGEQITLNPDGTLTVQADADIGSNVITYQIVDGAGNTDVGYLRITTVGAATVDGVVQGTAAGELIDTSYLGDPDGDRVDSFDATGIYGTQGQDDYILAGAGNDTVLAGDGNDSVFSDDGNDSVEAGAGNDVVSAGAGDDTVFGGFGDDVVYLGAGNDSFGTFQGDSAGNDSVYGGSGDDFIITGAANDRVEGGTGNDILSGGIGDDTLYGGDGADWFNITEDHEFDSIVGGEGGAFDRDVIWFGNFLSSNGVNVTFTDDEAGSYQYFTDTGNGQFQQIEGIGLTVYNDSIDAAATDQGVWISAFGGDDTVTGGAGADTIFGGAGTDQITGGGGADSINGGTGDDTITSGPDFQTFPEYTNLSGTVQTLTGTNGNTDFDHSLATDGPAVDTIPMVLDGGYTVTGYHVGNGGDANETHTHTFSQQVAGAILTLVQIDPTETVVIWLDGVAVNLNDAVANGLVAFDAGNTGFYINAAGAIAAYSAPVPQPVPATITVLVPFTTLSVQNVSPSGFGNGTAYTVDVNTNPPASTLLDADTVDAGDGNDLISTGWGNDLVAAGAGNDVVNAGSGDDQVSAGDGNDSVFAGEGADLVFGGLGNDTLDGGADGDVLDAGDGDDRLLGADGDDTLSGGAGQDSLYGGEGNDSLSDTAAATFADGGAGDDTVVTGSSADTVLGGAGNDSVEAGDGADSLDGGLGNDTLNGGTGDDTLTGGADQQVLTTQPADYTVLSGPSQTVTGTLGNPDFTHTVISDTGSVLLNDTTVFLSGGGSEQLSGYQVGDGLPSNEVHTHTFGNQVGSVQLRIVGLNTVETLIFTLDGQPLDLNQAIGLGLVSFDPGTTPYFVDVNGNLASAGDGSGPFVPATLTIFGPLTTLSVQNQSADGMGNGTLYELSVDTNPATETLADGADSLSGGLGSDLVAGGSGDDTLDGGDGTDSLSGDAGNDLITGGIGNDSLSGGAGQDTLQGGDDRDVVTGGANDVVDGGEGGDDFDTLIVNDVASIAYGGGNNEAGTVTFNDGSSLTFQNIERIIADGVTQVLADGIVHGTAGSESMAPGYIDAQNDIIDGADGLNDVVQAGDGDDTVDAGAGDDSIFGGSGNDVFVAGAGADTYDGGSGQDNLDASGASTGVSIDLMTGAMSGDLVGDDSLGFGVDGAIGSAFDDTLSGFDDFDPTYTNQLFGGAGNDLLDGRGGDDVLDGGTGNDTLTGGTGNDLVYGGDDRDLITAQGADTIFGGEGGDDFDTLVVDGIQSISYSTSDNESGTVTLTDGSTIVFSGIETIREAGSTPDGIIWGTGGSDVVGAGYIDANGDVIDNNDAILSNPGSDDDEVYALDGDDTIRTLLGDDRTYGGIGNDLVQTGVGNDYAQGDEGNDIVEGGDGDDFLRGDSGNDAVYGGDGNDSVYGGADSDTVYGGDGDDQVFGGFGTDTVYGGAGNDTITGSGEADQVHGDDGDDFLQGSNGADTLYGGLGADTMLGEEDADTFYGGSGDYVDGYETVTTGTDNDALYVTAVQTVVFDAGNSENGTITFLDGGTLQFFNIERLYVDGVLVSPVTPDYIVEGTSGADEITLGYLGDPEGDRVDASDNLAGSNADLIEAYGGNDAVSAGDGNDTVYGGTGDDTIDGGVGVDSLEGGEGNDQLFGGDNDDTLLGDGGDDSLFGGTGFDVLAGGAGADLLYGGLAGDLLQGGAGTDTVIGGDGNDLIFGQADADSLQGDAGDDTIFGDEGNDTLAGGADRDTVYGGDGDDRIVMDAGFGNDVIAGGETSEVAGDVLDASSLTSGIVLDLTATDPANPEDGTLDAGPGNVAVFEEIERFILGSGNDVVYGSDGADSVSTGAGADTVYGGAGNDRFDLGGADGAADLLVLSAGDGDDTITGLEAPTDNGDGTFTGRDQLDATGLTDGGGQQVNVADVVVTDSNGDGTGDAILTFPDGTSVTLQGVTPPATNVDAWLIALGIPGLGPDYIVEGTTADDLIDLSYLGDPEGDRIDAADNQTGANGDLVEAYGGNDSVLAGDGDDTVYGGVGDDTLLGEAGDDSLLGEDGNDSLDGGDGNDSIYGGAGNDTVVDGDGDDYVEGGDGDDFLDGPGNDTYYGGSGNDTINAGTGNDLVYGGIDNDVLNGEGDNDSLYGDNGNDQLFGGDGRDLIDGGAGNDNFIGGAGNDTSYGGSGDDSMGVGDTGDDLVYGGTGNDVLSGDLGSDTLYGDEGNDAIEGHDGADTVYGGLGNDYLAGFDVTGITTPANRTLNPVGIDDGSNDRLEGGDGNDTVLGGLGDDTLLGGADQDILLGGDGNDSLDGGTGNDQLFGGLGNDQMDGGEGADLLDGGAGADTLYGLAGNDSLLGGAGNDSLYGWGDDDTLDGGDNDDVVDGDEGSDSLSGGLGNDTIVGDAGNDTLSGGAGDDQLYGGTGNDTLYGGGGIDQIFGADDRDLVIVGAGEGAGSTVDGGETGDDYDTLDLRAWGKALTNVIYSGGNPENGTVEFLDGTGAVIGTMTFTNIENVIPCFTPGALIATDLGEVRVEDLRVGDRVLTRDNGYQEIRWIGRRDLTEVELEEAPQFRPVRIRKGALGLNLPERDLVVSPQHRMLVTASRAELLFGEHEVLVAAAHLTVRPGVTVEVGATGVSYIHLLFDRHEVIRANGSWTESYQPGEMTLAGMEDGPREEVLSLFPELKLGFLFPAARITLKKHEAKLLFTP